MSRGKTGRAFGVVLSQLAHALKHPGPRGRCRLVGGSRLKSGERLVWFRVSGSHAGHATKSSGRTHNAGWGGSRFEPPGSRGSVWCGFETMAPSRAMQQSRLAARTTPVGVGRVLSHWEVGRAFGVVSISGSHAGRNNSSQNTPHIIDSRRHKALAWLTLLSCLHDHGQIHRSDITDSYVGARPAGRAPA